MNRNGEMPESDRQNALLPIVAEQGDAATLVPAAARKNSSCNTNRLDRAAGL